MRWGNCWAWAIPKWLKDYFRGDALVIRKSAITWVPHAMRARCIKGLQIEEFIPEHFPNTKIGRMFPVQSICFKGRVRNGQAMCLCPECSLGRPQIMCKCKRCKNG